MGLFTKKEPILEYSGNSLESKISQLNDLKPKLNYEGQRIIEEDIKFFNIGYSGEKQLLFELKNSHMPLHIFYDVNLEYEDLKSQIDFIIIGEYKIFIIECKNYIGDIMVGYFDETSIKISKELGREYQKVAETYKCWYLNAMEYTEPCKADGVHLDREGHKKLAEVLEKNLKKILKTMVL